MVKKKPAPRPRKPVAAAKSKPPAAAPDAGAKPPPPAYFLSLTVENVRCFKGPETLDLSDGNGRPAPWTILLGDNGTGKTTLLQCLTEMQPVLIEWMFPKQNSWAPQAFRSGRFAYQPSTVAFGRDECRLFVEVGVGSCSEGNESAKLVKAEIEFNETSCGFHHAFTEEARGLICYGYGASRRLGGKGLGDNLNHPDPCASLFDDEAALTNAEEWLLQADYAALKDPKGDAQRRLDLVKQVLHAVLPGVSRIEAIAPPGFGQGAHVEVLHEGVRVPLRSLSSGYRSVLVWMVDLATRMLARYPDETEPLKQPAIVLVDQIDLHLHPKWQRSLIGKLSELFPKTQFIVTAHSPLIVQAAADVGANVAVLRREGDHVTIDQRLESVRGWSADQVLTSELFELPGVRGPDTDAWMAERRAILGKSRLTKVDEAKLVELDAWLDALPIGETPADRRAADLIRRAAAEIEQAKKPASRRRVVAKA